MILFPDTKYLWWRGGAWGLGTVTGYPCAGDVSSLFGATDMAEHADGHNGTDIAAAQGTAILAPCDMLVTDVFSLDVVSTDPLFQQIKDLFGNSVWATIGLSDGTGYRTMFAHMAEAPSVAEGQAVEAGTVLGYVGSTGQSTGPHLHWVLGQLENRWLARGAGNVEVLDYCGEEQAASFTPTGSGLIVEDKHATAVNAIQDARAALDRALAAMY
jgi:murein DD-endopeptidase MepM/ murein hydrolase activator NlpD